MSHRAGNQLPAIGPVSLSPLTFCHAPLAVMASLAFLTGYFSRSRLDPINRHAHEGACMPEFLAPGAQVEEITSKVMSIEAVSTSTTAFVGTTSRGPANKPITVTSQVGFERTFGPLSASFEMGYVIRAFFANGGREAVIVRVKGTGAFPRATEVIGSVKKKTGLYALEKVQRFGLLCLPPVKPGGDTPWSVYRAALRYCKQRRALVIVDSPASWGAETSGGVNSTLTALTMGAENAALYFPRLLQADPLQNGQPRLTVTCGAIAGVMARIDTIHGVWKAPAGLEATLNDVLGLQRLLKNAENDRLNPAGVNSLRNIDGWYLVWGGLTLSTNSEWRYVSVSRLALFMEASIENGIAWASLEPNGEPLWAKLRVVTESFLQNLWREGALLGTTPNEAYFVKCDRSTMTQGNIEKGLIVMLVGFAPLKPAEFVLLQIQIKAAVSA